MKTGEVERNQPAVDWLGHRRERRPLRRSAFRRRMALFLACTLQTSEEMKQNSTFRPVALGYK